MLVAIANNIYSRKYLILALALYVIIGFFIAQASILNISSILLLGVTLLFVLNIEKGIIVFFLASQSIQYLEKAHLGDYSALEIYGGCVPIIFSIALSTIKREKLLDIFRDRIIQIYFIFIIVSFLFNVFLAESSLIPQSERIGLWLKFVNGFVILVVVSSVFKNTKQFNLLMYAMLLSMTIPCSMALWQIISENTVYLWHGRYHVADAFLSHPGVFAYGLGLLFPVTLFMTSLPGSKRRQLFWIAVTCFQIILIYLTYRRNVWIGITIQLLVWGALNKMWRLATISSLVFLLLLVCFNIDLYVFEERFNDLYVFIANLGDSDLLYSNHYDRLMSGRVGIVKANITAFIESDWLHRLIGHGFGQADINPFSPILGLKGSHNIYLSLVVDCGIIGLFLYLALLGLILKRAWGLLSSSNLYIKNFSKSYIALIASYLVMGMATHLFHKLTTGVWLFWCFTALLLSCNKLDEEGPD